MILLIEHRHVPQPRLQQKTTADLHLADSAGLECLVDLVDLIFQARDRLVDSFQARDQRVDSFQVDKGKDKALCLLHSSVNLFLQQVNKDKALVLLSKRQIITTITNRLVHLPILTIIKGSTNITLTSDVKVKDVNDNQKALKCAVCNALVQMLSVK